MSREESDACQAGTSRRQAVEVYVR